VEDRRERQAPIPTQDYTRRSASQGILYVGEEQAGALLEVLQMANALEELVIETLTRGIEQGREEGRAEGMEQGRAEALAAYRRAVAHTVVERFGAVPAGLGLERADEARLEEILRRLVHAKRAEDLL
jgi:hypothetical protein